MFSQEQNYYKSHIYVHISCNRDQFDLKDPFARATNSRRFFALLFATTNEFGGNSSFKTVF